MLVASRPILTSSGEGPAAGVLIFGRLLDAATVERIASQYKLESHHHARGLRATAGHQEGLPRWKPGQPARIAYGPTRLAQTSPAKPPSPTFMAIPSSRFE